MYHNSSLPTKRLSHHQGKEQYELTKSKGDRQWCAREGQDRWELSFDWAAKTKINGGPRLNSKLLSLSAPSLLVYSCQSHPAPFPHFPDQWHKHGVGVCWTACREKRSGGPWGEGRFLFFFQVVRLRGDGLPTTWSRPTRPKKDNTRIATLCFDIASSSSSRRK
jgi:hypothetical protein